MFILKKTPDSFSTSHDTQGAAPKKHQGIVKLETLPPILLSWYDMILAENVCYTHMYAPCIIQPSASNVETERQLYDKARERKLKKVIRVRYNKYTPCMHAYAPYFRAPDIK